MPRLKQPISLFKRCIICVADLVANTCNKIPCTLSKADKKKHIKKICDYVQEIPQYAANDYMEAVLEILSWLYHTKYLRVALHPLCTALNFDGQANSEGVAASLISNLDKVCNIKHLHITTKSAARENLICKAFARNIRKFKCLTTLTIEMSLVTERMLQSIGQNCCSLQILHINSKIRFQSKDIRFVSKCKKMKWFILPEHYPHHFSAMDILDLLDNLPELEYLHVGNMASVLARLRVTNNIRTFGLKCFNALFCCPIDVSYLQVLHRVFPKLEKMHLTYTSGDDMSLLKSFKSLRKLSLEAYVADQAINLPQACHFRLTELNLSEVNLNDFFTPEMQLFPVLTMLYLRNCTSIDIPAVGILCPKIERLRVYQCRMTIKSKNALTHNSQAFLHLKMFHLMHSGTSSIKEPLMILLESSKNLEMLSLQDYAIDLHQGEVLGSSTMTNDMWRKLLEKNPLQNLCRLTIHSRHVTLDILPDILDSFGSLEYLSLSGPNIHVPPSEYYEVKKHLEKFDMKCHIDYKYEHVPRIAFTSVTGNQILGRFDSSCLSKEKMMASFGQENFKPGFIPHQYFTFSP